MGVWLANDRRSTVPALMPPLVQIRRRELLHLAAAAIAAASCGDATGESTTTLTTDDGSTTGDGSSAAATDPTTTSTDDTTAVPTTTTATTGEPDDTTATTATTGTTGADVVCMPAGTDTGLTVADFPVGACTLAMNVKDIYVLRDELGFYAMASRCTHVGCLLPCPVDDVMLCPCHGSRFNANGDLLSGVAASDLEHFLVSFECVDDEVKIYVDTSQALADRQTRAPV